MTSQPRQPPRIEAVLFDAVGTLIFAEPSVAHAYWAAARQFGSERTLDDVRHRFQAAFRHAESDDQQPGAGNTDERRERQRWAGIIHEVFPEVADQAALLDVLWDHFAQPDSWRLFADVADCWTTLRRRNLTLGLASNFDSRLHAIWQKLIPEDVETPVFVSSELGQRKPHAAFFVAIQRSLALPPEQMLLVGDDWENDILGGRAAGWRTVLIDRRNSSALDDESPRLRSLAELVPWLDRQGWL